MCNSIWSQSVENAFAQASTPRIVHVLVDQKAVQVSKPFSSPADWRDQPIYFLMVDRFENPDRPPQHPSYDGQHGVFQGGNLAGIRQRLDYLKDLGIGAIWLSPVIKNCPFEDTTYHGYGFQDFLRIDHRFASNPAAAASNPNLVEGELRELVDESHARGIYVIFDIVLNHVGNVFEYEGFGAVAPFRDDPYPIRWRDQDGLPFFPDFSQAPPDLSRDAAVWPNELHHDDFFRRQGKGGEAEGDFESLKELVTEHKVETPFGYQVPVRQALIRAYQYLIARYDVDGFRIDTLKYIEPEFARTFGNAMREYALSIGKRNFLTFGEVYDEEERIARFIGRNAAETGEPIGVDAALDFPLFFRLPGVMKGFISPVEIARMYEQRKEIQRGIITSHGEASGHFVTFLDNHDMRERFFFRDPADPGRWDDQLTMAAACLFSLQGIPCLYYGTEQGLHGRGSSDQAVREALWGKDDPFDRSHPFFEAIQKIARVRGSEPALRYGRQYFRGVSGNGVQFGLSPFPGGVLAFSRILNEREVVVVANPHSGQAFEGEVIVDAFLNPEDATYAILYSNQSDPHQPGTVMTKAPGSVEIRELDERVTTGPAKVIRIHLESMEVQILARICTSMDSR